MSIGHFFAAKEEGEDVGFLCLKETGKATVELAVMGVLMEHHRKGVGRELVEKAKEVARLQGYEFMQVKTVKMGMYGLHLDLHLLTDKICQNMPGFAKLKRC